MGLHQWEIIEFLAKTHNIHISMRTLRRHLKRMRLRRRKHYTALDEVILFLKRQVYSSGQLHGYRWMHLKCIQAGYTVTQETVRLLLQTIDPEGVTIRKRNRLRRRQYSTKGPNYLWHVDSYDKLKPYGICVNGCIDGFSRKIIWLRASYTSSNSKVIGGNFFNAIHELGGCPRTVRTDLGTENKQMEHMQTDFRELTGFQFSNPPFLTGTSQHNQRIESWWNILRKHSAQFWMYLFQQVKEDGLFTGTFLDKSLIQYCFMDIIQVSFS